MIHQISNGGSLNLTRRHFMRLVGVSGTFGGAAVLSAESNASESKSPSSDSYGVLIDTTVCIGCRECEWACSDLYQLSDKPLGTFRDKSVFARSRRPHAKAYTVVNQYQNPKDPEKPYYVKIQCMHCNDPACASACLVGALQKDKVTGAVSYDSWRCIGCRYCMIACPFQIPAYEYYNALTPQVRKCVFCQERISKQGKSPACVSMCPVEALRFGKRADLIQFAHDQIRNHPQNYVDHIYGEHELGGTAWLYLSGRPITEMDMIAFDQRPIPSYTEPLQHAIFKNFIPPISLFSLIGGIMWIFRNRDAGTDETKGGDHERT